MDTFWLEWLPIMVATAASFVGVVVAVSQVNATSRFRHRATFWSEQLHTTDLAHDREVAQSLQREAVARIVALQAYPGWKLLWPSLMFVLVAYSVGAAGYTAGTLAPSENAYQRLQEQGIEPLFILSSIPFLGFGCSGVASIVVRRRRLARHYIEGLDLTREQPTEREGGATAGLNLSCLGLLGLLSFSSGICLLIAIFSFIAGTPKEDPSILATFGGWYFGAVFTSVVLLLLGLFPVAEMFTQESGGWEHPRKLTPHAGKPHRDESDSTAAWIMKRSCQRRVLTWIKFRLGLNKPARSDD